MSSYIFHHDESTGKTTVWNKAEEWNKGLDACRQANTTFYEIHQNAGKVLKHMDSILKPDDFKRFCKETGIEVVKRKGTWAFRFVPLPPLPK